MIFISHKLHEVMAVSDRVTVLRAGKALATVQTAGATPQSLATLMVGRDIEPVTREGQARPDSPPVLEVEDLWAEGDRGMHRRQGCLADRPGGRDRGDRRRLRQRPA